MKYINCFFKILLFTKTDIFISEVEMTLILIFFFAEH